MVLLNIRSSANNLKMIEKKKTTEVLRLLYKSTTDNEKKINKNKKTNKVNWG